MRLSGNYFDRLLINVLPWTIFVGGIIYFTKADTKGAFIVFIISTAAFWIIDTLIIFIKFRKPHSLTFRKTLQHNGDTLLPTQIDSIYPITDKRYRWSFNMVEFLLIDGDKFFVIEKPKTILAELRGQESYTIKKILEYVPELEQKIGGRKYI